MLICIVLHSLICFSQNDTINFTDDQNKKQGYWIFTNQHKKLPGYQSNQKVEEGFFVNNKKEGKWVFYYRNGKMRSTGSYIDGKEIDNVDWDGYDDANTNHSEQEVNRWKGRRITQACAKNASLSRVVPRVSVPPSFRPSRNRAQRSLLWIPMPTLQLI